MNCHRLFTCLLGALVLFASALLAEPTESVRKQGRAAPQPVQVQIVQPANSEAPRILDPTTQTSTGTMSGEQLKWQVLSGGGGRSSSASYVMHMTIGQTAVGQTTNATYRINQGFWQNFSASCCLGITGNLDGDPGDLTDPSDLQAIVDFIFFNIDLPGTCFQENDVQKDGTVDPSDLQAIVDYIFFNFPPYDCP